MAIAISLPSDIERRGAAKVVKPECDRAASCEHFELAEGSAARCVNRQELFCDKCRNEVFGGLDLLVRPRQ